MNGHDIVGGILALKAAIDTVRSLGGLFPGRKAKPALIPVYRLVPAAGAEFYCANGTKLTERGRAPARRPGPC
jgi:hypothetical protein